MDRHEAAQIVSRVRTTLNGETATKLVHNPEPLKFLSEQIGNRKVAIICIAGIFRSGKGFLFSLFVHYLEWLAAGAKGSWIDLKKRINSFRWKSGRHGDTKGIYVYNKPFIVKTESGDEIAIILMDTQGTYDTQLTGSEMSSIFALSTMLSSVQIYNLKNNIGMPDLQHLAFFTHLASHSKQTAEGDAKIFQAKMIGNRPLEGISLLNIFEQYVEDFQGNSLPQPDSMLRSINRVGCMNAKDSAVKEYNQMMGSILKELTTEESLRSAHEKAYNEALTYFKSIIPKGCVMNADEVRQKLGEILEDQLRLALADLMAGDIEKIENEIKPEKSNNYS